MPNEKMRRRDGVARGRHKEGVLSESIRKLTVEAVRIVGWDVRR